MTEVRFTARALTELRNQIRWLQARSPTAAQDATAAIERATLALSEHPMAGTPFGEGFRRWHVNFGRSGYVMFYRVREDYVSVVRFYHGRQDR